MRRISSKSLASFSAWNLLSDVLVKTSIASCINSFNLGKQSVNYSSYMHYFAPARFKVILISSQQILAGSSSLPGLRNGLSR